MKKFFEKEGEKELRSTLSDEHEHVRPKRLRRKPDRFC
jgi:hypothetical protein